MVVLAILGLLAALSISKFGSAFDGAKVDTARMFVNTSVKVPLFQYKMHLGEFPSTQDGLQALITAPSSKADRWKGPYIESSKVPTDPWGETYKYAFPGTHNKDGYDIWSAGSDGQSGTEDDIGNWEKATK